MSDLSLTRQPTACEHGTDVSSCAIMTRFGNISTIQLTQAKASRLVFSTIHLVAMGNAMQMLSAAWKQSPAGGRKPNLGCSRAGYEPFQDAQLRRDAAFIFFIGAERTRDTHLQRGGYVWVE